MGDFNECIYKLGSKKFGDGSQAITDQTHDCVAGGYVVDIPDRKPSDTILENSCILKLGQDDSLKNIIKSFDIRERDDFRDKFSNPENIFVRDAFINHEKSKILGLLKKSLTATNMGLSGSLDQAGMSPSKFYKYLGKQMAPGLSSKGTEIVAKGGLCMYKVKANKAAEATLPAPPHFFAYTAYYTCDLLLHWYFATVNINGNGVAVEAEEGAISKPPRIDGLNYDGSYANFLTSYRILIENKKKEEIKTIISNINIGNFNVIWQILVSEICSMVFKDSYIISDKCKNKDQIIGNSDAPGAIYHVQECLKRIKFKNVEFTDKEPKLYFNAQKLSSPDTKMFSVDKPYKNSQKSIALRAQFHNLAYAKKMNDKKYRGFIDPSARGDDESKPSPDSTASVNAVEMMLTDYCKHIESDPAMSHLTTTIGLCLLKLSGDTSHSTVGQQIENAIKKVGYENRTIYLVQERPYFARLVLCKKNIIMNTDKARKALKDLELTDNLKPFQKINLSKKLLCYESNIKGQAQDFYNTLASTIQKLNGLVDSEPETVGYDKFDMRATQNLIEYLKPVLESGSLESLDRIDAYKENDEYKLFLKIKSFLDLPLDLGYDDKLLKIILEGKGDTSFSIFSPKPTGEENKSGRVSGRVRKRKGEVGGMVDPMIIQFNPMFIFNRNSHKMITDILPFFNNLVSLMELSKDFDASRKEELKVILKKRLNKIINLSDRNTNFKILLELFSREKEDKPKIILGSENSPNYLKEEILKISDEDKYRAYGGFEKEQMIDDAFQVIKISLEYKNYSAGQQRAMSGGKPLVELRNQSRILSRKPLASLNPLKQIYKYIAGKSTQSKNLLKISENIKNEIIEQQQYFIEAKEIKFFEGQQYDSIKIQQIVINTLLEEYGLDKPTTYDTFSQINLISMNIPHDERQHVYILIALAGYPTEEAEKIDKLLKNEKFDLECNNFNNLYRIYLYLIIVKKIKIETLKDVRDTFISEIGILFSKEIPDNDFNDNQIEMMNFVLPGLSEAGNPVDYFYSSLFEAGGTDALDWIYKNDDKDPRKFFERVKLFSIGENEFDMYDLLDWCLDLKGEDVSFGKKIIRLLFDYVDSTECEEEKQLLAYYAQQGGHLRIKSRKITRKSRTNPNKKTKMTNKKVNKSANTKKKSYLKKGTIKSKKK
jgi:hypothetical protein